MYNLIDIISLNKLSIIIYKFNKYITQKKIVKNTINPNMPKIQFTVTINLSLFPLFKKN